MGVTSRPRAAYHSAEDSCRQAAFTGEKAIIISPSLLSDPTQTQEAPHQLPDFCTLFTTLLPRQPDLRPAGAWAPPRAPPSRHLPAWSTHLPRPHLCLRTLDLRHLTNSCRLFCSLLLHAALFCITGMFFPKYPLLCSKVFNAIPLPGEVYYPVSPICKALLNLSLSPFPSCSSPELPSA